MTGDLCLYYLAQPPSYASFDVITNEASSIRTISPPPSSNLPAQYLLCQAASPGSHPSLVYYCLYQHGSRLRTTQTYGSSEENRKGGIGRLDIHTLSPPRNVKGLKRCIAHLEGFQATEVEEIFLTSESSEGEEDSARLDLSASAPGYDPNAAIHVTILDGALRAPPGDPSGSAVPTGSRPTVVSPPVDSNILIHKNAVWSVDASGFAEPACLPGKSWQITGAKEPPGWIPARVKTDLGHVLEFRKSEEFEPTTNVRSYLVKRDEALLVDPRKIIKDSLGKRFYRAIFVRLGVIRVLGGLLHYTHVVGPLSKLINGVGASTANSKEWVGPVRARREKYEVKFTILLRHQAEQSSFQSRYIQATYR
ncbi:hypothetical protein DL93DRAFT_2097468 [Clavulina sp. PMI_390]|nr:hypothetical protein DL93DRAFT_2097468 [Clavulina sp. PMI_390]